MAEKKNKKPAQNKEDVTNTSRRNGKAWKKRECGKRHAPGTCIACSKNSKKKASKK